MPVHFSRVAQPGMVYLWYAYDWRDYGHSGPATVLGANLNVREALDPVNEAFAEVRLNRLAAAKIPESMGTQVEFFSADRQRRLAFFCAQPPRRLRFEAQESERTAATD